MRSLRLKESVLTMTVFLAGSIANAEELTVPVHRVDSTGIQEQIGTIKLSDSQFGLLLKPDVSKLPPGLRGFHVHEKPSCEPGIKEGKPEAAGAAGPHLDPRKTSRHEGPYGSGHTGDLPPLAVNEEGRAELPLLAPQLKLTDVRGRALMIHEGGDNYADQPQQLGGGRARIACAVVPRQH